MRIAVILCLLITSCFCIDDDEVQFPGYRGHQKVVHRSGGGGVRFGGRKGGEGNDGADFTGNRVTQIKTRTNSDVSWAKNGQSWTY